MGISKNYQFHHNPKFKAQSRGKQDSRGKKITVTRRKERESPQVVAQPNPLRFLPAFDDYYRIRGVRRSVSEGKEWHPLIHSLKNIDFLFFIFFMII
jgi:hypothetical protein